MRLLTRLAALLATLALVWVCAPSAMAGGPTSVLITSPESGETAALYTSDAAYQQLMREVGAWDGAATPPTGTKKRPSSLDGVVGLRQINVVWMIHDIDPWRVDRVFASPDPHRIWIQTESRFPVSGEGLWHEARGPEAMHDLLTELGLMGPKMRYGEAAAADPPATAPATGEQPEEKSAGRPAAADGDGSVWWWAIPALAGGIAIGLVLRPLATRLPRPPFTRKDPRDDGPRQQLVDI
jgi:hypothetical protein